MGRGLRIFFTLLSGFALAIIPPSHADAAETAGSKQFRRALPGYVFAFPQDHFSHNDFKTEWWYYTGHLHGAHAEKFGFELTFFRSAVPDMQGQVVNPRWQVDNIYLAHFAVSDLNAKRFFFQTRMNRPGLATGGASAEKFHVWNGGWNARLDGDAHRLKAGTPDYSLNLKLTPIKSPVIHGRNGVSQKASCVGCASHYYSMTRMNVEGTVLQGNRNIAVRGTAWMDHEFGSNQLTEDQIGWDWFSIQLDDSSELMLYLMRMKPGGFDANSSGTIVDAAGNSSHLLLQEFSVKPTGSWRSRNTSAQYPSGWEIEVPARQIRLSVKPLLIDQELYSNQPDGISYWEGACAVEGTVGTKHVTGRAYVELTGYAGAFKADI